MAIVFYYQGKGDTFIKIKLLNKARKGTYKKDVIEMDIKSVTARIRGVMTEEEALLVAHGLLNAVTGKMDKEKRI